MKITLCLSLAFYDKMIEIENQLTTLGHKVKTPPHQVPNEVGDMIPVAEYYKIRKNGFSQERWIWDTKRIAMINHFDKVAWSDAILVLNYDKNGVKNYIGANTFLEMGVAFYLGKKIYLLNDIPEVSFKEEILGMNPFILSGTIDNLKSATYNPISSE